MILSGGQNVNITAKHTEFRRMLASPQNQSEASLREALRDILSQLFAGTLDPAQVMTADYIQHTDGKRLDYNGFVAHLKHVRNAVREVRFEVLGACCTGNLLADRHIAEVHHHDGHISRIEVSMFTRLADGRITSIDETTRSLDGSDADRDLAHAQA
jgi:uncharacterized tellurite resistance protein B-like protein